MARIDTGAAYSGLPYKLVEALGLKRIGTLQIVDGHGTGVQRDTVLVTIRVGELSATVEATVRHGKRLGLTAIISRDFLVGAAVRRPVLVIVPPRCGIHFKHPTASFSYEVVALSDLSVDSCARSSSDSSSSSVDETEAHRQQLSVVPVGARVTLSHPDNRSRRSITVVAKIDTGASACAIPFEFSRSLGLKALGTVKVRGSHDRTQRRALVLLRLSIGDVSRVVHATVRKHRRVLVGRDFLVSHPFAVDASVGSAAFQ